MTDYRFQRNSNNRFFNNQRTGQDSRHSTGSTWSQRRSRFHRFDSHPSIPIQCLVLKRAIITLGDKGDDVTDQIKLLLTAQFFDDMNCYRSNALECIIDCVLNMPHKTGIYSSLVGLINNNSLNARQKSLAVDIMRGVVLLIYRSLFTENVFWLSSNAECGLSDNFVNRIISSNPRSYCHLDSIVDNVIVLLRFLCGLMACKVIHPDSLIAVFESTLEAIKNSNESDFVDLPLLILISVLPWIGNKDYQTYRSVFDNLIDSLSDLVAARAQKYSSWGMNFISGDYPDRLAAGMDCLLTMRNEEWKSKVTLRFYQSKDLDFKPLIKEAAPFELPRFHIFGDRITKSSVRLKTIVRFPVSTSSVDKILLSHDRWILEDYIIRITNNFSTDLALCVLTLNLIPVGNEPQFFYIVVEVLVNLMLSVGGSPYVEKNMDLSLYYLIILFNLEQASPNYREPIVKTFVSFKKRLGDFDTEGFWIFSKCVALWISLSGDSFFSVSMLGPVASENSVKIPYINYFFQKCVFFHLSCLCGRDYMSNLLPEFVPNFPPLPEATCSWLNSIANTRETGTPDASFSEAPIEFKALCSILKFNIFQHPEYSQTTEECGAMSFNQYKSLFDSKLIERERAYVFVLLMMNKHPLTKLPLKFMTETLLWSDKRFLEFAAEKVQCAGYTAEDIIKDFWTLDTNKPELNNPSNIPKKQKTELKDIWVEPSFNVDDDAVDYDEDAEPVWKTKTLKNEKDFVYQTDAPVWNSHQIIQIVYLAFLCQGSKSDSHLIRLYENYSFLLLLLRPSVLELIMRDAQGMSNQDNDSMFVPKHPNPSVLYQNHRVKPISDGSKEEDDQYFCFLIRQVYEFWASSPQKICLNIQQLLLEGVIPYNSVISYALFNDDSYDGVKEWLIVDTVLEEMMDFNRFVVLNKIDQYNQKNPYSAGTAFDTPCQTLEKYASQAVTRLLINILTKLLQVHVKSIGGKDNASIKKWLFGRFLCYGRRYCVFLDMTATIDASQRLLDGEDESISDINSCMKDCLNFLMSLKTFADNHYYVPPLLTDSQSDAQNDKTLSNTDL